MKSTSQHKSVKLSGLGIDKNQLAVLTRKTRIVFQEIVRQERLDGDIDSQFESIYVPLASWIAEKHSDHPVVIGINGAQGAGKSTLSKILKSLLLHGFGKNVAILSIDDLYLSKEKRNKLARNISELLSVRGVPGTHDVSLGIKIISQMKNGIVGKSLLLPVFDKAQDDLLPESGWLTVKHPADIILFEGWCVGSIPQNKEELNFAINDLERNEDQKGIWRKYVNDQLSGPYRELFSFIDHLIMLQVPDMHSVYEWRKLQEKKLWEQHIHSDAAKSHIMTEGEVERFIMFYERITRHTLNEMPKRADVLLTLNKQHQVSEIKVVARKPARFC